MSHPALHQQRSALVTGAQLDEMDGQLLDYYPGDERNTPPANPAGNMINPGSDGAARDGGYQSLVS